MDQQNINTVIIHRAAWVLADPDHILENGYVKTKAGIIVDVGRGRVHGAGDQIIDHGAGVLMPSLVNAHTHLELSSLKNQTDISSGFISWVQSVIEKRDEAGEQKLLEGVFDSIHELTDSGTMVIGDISSTGLSRKPFLASQLSGVWFFECLGADREVLFDCENSTPEKYLSLAGHAPHTTASDLLSKLKSLTASLHFPFSLHLAESADEVAFLTTGKGPWANFLNQRNVDTSSIKRTGAGPVKYADQLGLLDEKTLAVHLTFADKSDIALLAAKKVNACLCPRSNTMLHHHLPDVPQMLKSGLRLCLGTDSLASNDSLSLFDEMKFLSQVFSDISPKDIIAMATVNGAAALGFENQFGTLAPGKKAGMIFVPVHAGNADIIESVVAADFYGKIKNIG